MYFRSTFAVLAVASMIAAVPDETHFLVAPPGTADLGQHFSNPSLADVFVSVIQQSSKKSQEMQPHSRLEIIRYVSGEFAKTVKPIPGGKKGFKLDVGKKLDDKDLNTALRNQGAAANPGDTVQITSIEFRAKEIAVQINGGGKKRFHLREHLQVGIGNTATPPPMVNPNEGTGATLILDYGRNIPDMSAEDLMHDLGPFLDFSKQHSATVNWIETLPPQFKQAIQDHEVLEGMDHEMVLAALGRPEHKVRERSPEGDETEDWIYGTPPAKTVFVTFSGDKVIRVKRYG
jgi:hypothetical protein